MKTYAQSIEQARKQVDQLFQRSDFAIMLSRSTTGILGMIFAMQGGQDWAKKAVDEEGQPLLTPAEQEVWTAACEPYLPLFRGWQRGGADLLSVPSVPTVPTVPSLSVDPFGSAETPSATTETPSAATEATGPDDLFESAYAQYEKANSTIHRYVAQHGPIQMSTFDRGEDIPLFPKIMTTALQGYPATKGVGMALEKVKLPPRTIYVIVYLLLDMARISASVAGADQNRKILSVILAVIDVLRGDWKRAILSLLGYAGSSQLYLGQILKVYLALFQTINPRLQRDIIFGTYSLGKSLLIGGLLAVFQVTAPASVRVPVIEMLEKLAERKEAIDGVLMEQGLAPRSDDLAVSFEDIQRIQSLMDDTAFICSKEYEELTKHVQNNFALRMVFQLVGIPTSDTFKKQRCGKGPRKPLVDNIVKESLDHPERAPEELIPEEPEKIIPTTEATDEQVEAAIQKVDSPSEPGALPIQNPEESSSLPPTIQKQEERPKTEESPSLPPTIQKPSESSTPEESPLPSTSLPPTIRKRGGRSLRRGHSSRE
jgi:hypothetical protein